MRTLLTGGQTFREGRLRREDLLLQDGKIAAIGPSIAAHGAVHTIPCSNLLITPGLVDVHVHLREPGFSLKETIRTGTLAAARGGFTTVCAMPNLRPVPDTLPHLEEQLALIRAGALVHVRPYGAITLGQEGLALADLAALAEHVVGFTDDGHGVQSADLTRQAMLAARALDRPISAHCEDTALAAGGVIHAGPYAAAHGLPGIPSASEWRPLERDLALVRETGCRYHALHVSTKESVALIRAAKAEGLPVTAETAPHYLTLTEADLRDEGRFKMNPPLRETADQNALLEALADGTIDVIATDHAPHTAAEKAGGLRESLMGIVGLETALPVLFTRLVLPGLLSLPRLLTALCDAPRALLRLPGGLRPGAPADLALLDLSTPYAIHPESFRSLGRATPFEGWPVRGRAALTMVGGEIVHQEA